MRKVLSFVLVLSLVLGSFSMAFAATPATGLSDIDGIANEDAIQVNFDLGIVTGNPDGTFLPAKTVTRAEFAAMITRALAIPDSALAGYTATSFKDTAGYSWAVPYLAFCQSKGIMLGDGAGNAMPGKTISTNEAMTMALRAIGYTANSAELVGVWPSNYVTLAQNNDLYDDVAAVTNVDKANAAQIIYNLLTVQKVAVNSDGETKPLWVGKESDDKAATLLNTGLGCEAEDAMILDNNNTADAKINMTPYLGAYAIVYTDSDDDIIAVGEIKSTFLKGDYDATTFELEVGDVTYTNVKAATLSATPAAVTFVNADDTLTNAAVQLTTDGTITIAAKISGKKVTNIYSVAAWSLTHGQTESTAFMYDDDLDLDDNEIAGIAFPEDDDDAIDYDKFILTGVTSLDKIAKDNVVYVYTNDAGDITKLAVGTETVTGKVTKLNSDNEPTIGGKAYEVSSAPNNETTIAVGETGTAYLDASGKIYKWDADNAASGNYAIVLGSANKTGLGKGEIKLLSKDGVEKIYQVDIDGQDGTTVTSIAATGSVVDFSLDKDGEIDEVNLKALVAAKSGDGKLSSTGKVFDGRSVDAGVVVFTKDGTDYDVITLADVARDTDLTASGDYRGTYTDSKIEVMVIDADDTDAESVYAVLNSVEDAVNDDDDEVQFISGFAGGTVFEAYTDDDNTVALTPAFAQGTLYVLDVNADGVVVDATAVVATVGALEAYVKGTITDKDGNYEVKVTTGAVEQFYTIDSKAVVYQLDTDEDEYVAKSISSLKADDLVYMWQVDEDSEQYDVIVYVRP